MRTNRRDILKFLGSLALVGPVLSALGQQIAYAAATIYKKADLATEKKNPSLVAFKYVTKASDSKDRTDKMGVKAADQTCANCNFYKNEGTLEGTKEKVGQCLMLQNQAVHAGAWCNLWAKKA
jgi:hypothetical protein